MTAKKRVCIAEDYTILREGLRALLSSDLMLEVVCEAGDGLELIEQCRQHAPDLVLLDLSMPRLNGLETIPEIKKRLPDTKIIVLTMHDAEQYISAALKAGVDGYVLKDATHAELKLAIQNVFMGKTYLSPGVSEKVIKGYLQAHTPETAFSAWDTLTHRERELLQLISEGHTNKEIASCLCLSIRTVETHRASLMKKLQLHNAAALTEYAISQGLLRKL